LGAWYTGFKEEKSKIIFWKQKSEENGRIVAPEVDSFTFSANLKGI